MNAGLPRSAIFQLGDESKLQMGGCLRLCNTCPMGLYEMLFFKGAIV
jgi:hypothetical protein